MTTYYQFGVYRAHQIYFADEGDSTIYYFQAPTGETSEHYDARGFVDVEATIRKEIDRWIKELTDTDTRAYLHYTILDLIEKNRRVGLGADEHGKLTAYLDMLNRLYNWDREPVEMSNAEIHICAMLKCN